MFKKSMKKVLSGVLITVMVLSMAGCSKEEKSSKTLYTYSKSATDIASWATMATPTEGSGSGTVTKGDDTAIIKAASDGWGGVQSEKITLDLSKSPILMVQVKEIADGFKWGAKFVPSEPVVTEHEWGFYLLEDNNLKYNNYAAVDIREKLGEDFVDAYGEKVEGVLWIFATASADATVEVSSVKMFDQK